MIGIMARKSENSAAHVMWPAPAKVLVGPLVGAGRKLVYQKLQKTDQDLALQTGDIGFALIAKSRIEDQRVLS